MSSFSDLLEGYRQFRSTGWRQQRERWETLREGQSPRVMIIACSDSRVDPAQIFNTRPGEVFVVRNVAALVPPFELEGSYHGVSAALEFAIQVLKVDEVVVMGHGMCGGCQAALTQELADAEPGQGGFIANWIKMLGPAREQVVREHGHDPDRPALRAMEQAAVQVSIDNLRTFPCVQHKEAKGTLKLIGAYFAISDGILHLLDHESGSFQPVD
ncbi:MAG: carbonic anhydrase [Blastomonas sp.]